MLSRLRTESEDIDNFHLLTILEDVGKAIVTMKELDQRLKASITKNLKCSHSDKQCNWVLRMKTP